MAVCAVMLIAETSPVVSQQAAPKGRPPAQPAASEPAKANQPSSWAWRCTNQVQSRSGCEMFQVIIDEQTRRRLASVSITLASDGPLSVMLITIPHGVFIPSGVTLSIEKAAAIPLAFQKSDQGGLYAALPLTDKHVADLSAGSTFTLAVQVNKGTDFPIRGQLNGFAPAHAKVMGK